MRFAWVYIGSNGKLRREYLMQWNNGLVNGRVKNYRRLGAECIEMPPLPLNFHPWIWFGIRRVHEARMRCWVYFYDGMIMCWRDNVDSEWKVP
jgi:hypothetical protein